MDAATASQITDSQRIIAFRNILIQGYDAVDHRIVWDVVQGNLRTLHQQVIGLLSQDLENGSPDAGGAGAKRGE